MKAFFVPGLGASVEVFDKIGDIGIPKVDVPWMEAQKKESLESYASRQIAKHKITKDDITIGLSFGGLVAQHIAKQLGHDEVVLISSMRTFHDLQPLLRYGTFLYLHKLMPPLRIPGLDFVIAKFFNSSNKESDHLLKKMLVGTNYPLMKWSMDKIRQQSQIVDPELKLHSLIGDKDRIMTTWQADNTIEVPGGTHFMVYDYGQRMTEEIRRIIGKSSN